MYEAPISKYKSCIAMCTISTKWHKKCALITLNLSKYTALYLKHATELDNYTIEAYYNTKGICLIHIIANFLQCSVSQTSSTKVETE